VTAFVPRGPGADGSYHLVGVQIVQASAFRPLTPGQPADSIRGLYDRMIDEQPGTVRGWVSEAAFWDVGTVADYWRTSQAFLEKAADGNSCGRGVQIDPTAEVRRSILWDDVRVGAHAVLDECVVADGVRVPANRSFRRVSLVNAGETLTVTPWETGAAGQR
jgi:NDP-sugar pyrophosphorylase family protein